MAKVMLDLPKVTDLELQAAAELHCPIPRDMEKGSPTRTPEENVGYWLTEYVMFKIKDTEKYLARIDAEKAVDAKWEAK